ncbi:MAG: SDR family oxidoreductase [Bacteroidetes bacterium]|nr:SDR family oxidoreductase [Bacteroidota bacterium]
MTIQDKVVIVTGASSGIGKALAVELVKKEAKVVMAARNVEKLEEIQQSIDKDKNRTIIVRTDVTDESSCKNLIEESVAQYGRIDVLINNAGISMRALFSEVDLDVLKKLMDTNFWGMVYCTKYALPHIEKSSGSIAAISSIAGYKGLPGRTGYSASKFAMHGFIETLRIELLNKNVHVLLACPGFTNTNIRKIALNDKGNTQGESPLDESKVMPAAKVAVKIITAIERKKRDLILSSRAMLWANKWWPKWIDKKVYNMFAKENDPLLK